MKTFRMDLPFSLFLLGSCLFEAQWAAVISAPEVTVNNTRIVGQHTRQCLHLVSAYLGIPYATPPVGPLRFQKTVPLQTLPPVIHAVSFKPDCISTYPNHQQSEDCLYLNVWVPGEATTAPLPVMVWIHGGGFITGSANSPQGKILAAVNQVVVVSLNYRLGALGFLSTGDGASKGNYGLWDQHTGLRWVRDNIGSFGGDPDRITIFGESAGGKSVSFQVVSPYSGHLFQRAIMQSGTVLCPTALQWKPVESAVRLARAVGCPSDNHQTLLQCLRERTAFQIASASNELWADDVLRYLIDFGWGPVEDGDFVPKLYHPDGTPTPLSPTFTGSLMLGTNNNEGALLKAWRIPVTTHLDHDIEDQLHDPGFFTHDFLPKVLAQMFKTFPEDTPTFTTASQAVSSLYTNGNPGSSIKSRDLYDTFGDQAYVSPTFHFVEQWLNTTQFRDKVFVYVFDNYPGVPAEEGLEGMKHGDDVPYTFGTIAQKLLAERMASDVVAREARLSQNFRKLLTNFAKTGNPASPEPVDSDWPTLWPAYDVQQQRYLSVSSTPAVSDHYRANYMTLWNHRMPSIVACDTGRGTSSNTCIREDLIG